MTTEVMPGTETAYCCESSARAADENASTKAVTTRKRILLRFIFGVLFVGGFLSEDADYKSHEPDHGYENCKGDELSEEVFHNVYG